ncbi:phosphopantetheine attachment site family protein [Mycobacterium kansasii]|uniref:Phosphopantetheine attachment site family protein n=1 Tax=Mycobacterium kansasii TaxID=1768 RepID=A0A1V3X6T2_MYCKA|nr:phosphopantetheine attachment site family protein [Mycobacterium kansasii]
MFVGRADRQVKVRGFRIEPAEVERQLAAHPAIRQVRVCTRRHPDGRHELLAYLVLAANLTFDAYHRHLADTVAPYMRPQHTYVVDALPHTANGKVDEAALLNCAVAPWRRPRTVECHAGATLRELLELAGGVLGVADLAASDRFVTSGGDSLTALRLRFEIQRRWQVDVPPADVIGKDFAALADAIDTGAHAGHYPPVPARPACAARRPRPSNNGCGCCSSATRRTAPTTCGWPSSCRALPTWLRCASRYADWWPAIPRCAPGCGPPWTACARKSVIRTTRGTRWTRATAKRGN